MVDAEPPPYENGGPPNVGSRDSDPPPIIPAAKDPDLYFPIYVMTGVYGAIFIIVPLLIRKGPNQGLIRCCIWMAVFSMWILWFTVYVAQMNPLVGPRMKNTTVAWIAQSWGDEAEPPDEPPPDEPQPDEPPPDGDSGDGGSVGERGLTPTPPNTDTHDGGGVHGPTKSNETEPTDQPSTDVGSGDGGSVDEKSLTPFPPNTDTDDGGGGAHGPTKSNEAEPTDQPPTDVGSGDGGSVDEKGLSNSFSPKY